MAEVNNNSGEFELKQKDNQAEEPATNFEDEIKIDDLSEMSPTIDAAQEKQADGKTGVNMTTMEASQRSTHDVTITMGDDPQRTSI